MMTVRLITAMKHFRCKDNGFSEKNNHLQRFYFLFSFGFCKKGSQTVNTGT